MNVPLTTEILKDLKHKGYNILKSDNSVDDVIQHFVPTTVNDLWAFQNSENCVSLKKKYSIEEACCRFESG
ncbi:hypothetical protein [Sphingobacterium faecium]|uniref:hypothetical protein n=1 Tax=Sphingobacterium faecium TaxID=34087 RepID=UPI00320AEDDA